MPKKHFYESKENLQMYTIIFFSTVLVYEIGCFVNYPLYKLQGFKGTGKSTNLYQMEKIWSSKHFINQSVKISPQIPGLEFRYLSLKFGHEIDLKGLMYLVLLDLRMK